MLINYEQWTQHTCRRNMLVLQLYLCIWYNIINIEGLYHPILSTNILIDLKYIIDFETNMHTVFKK